MLTLYHCVGARSFRVLWTLEEMRLAYELKMLPFPPRVHRREYLQVNPLGTVPAFFDGEMRMTESAAIAQYLVSRYGPSPLAVAVDDPDYGRWLNWQYFGEATLTFPQALVLRYSKIEPPERRHPGIVDDYTKWFRGRLRAVEAVVSAQPYLCAGRFTTADVSVGYALQLARRLRLAADWSPAVVEYWARLEAREAYRRALEAERRAAREQDVDSDLEGLLGTDG